MTIERHNDNFFTEQVELTDDAKADIIVSGYKGFSSPLPYYIAKVEEHLVALKRVETNNPTVKDIRISWNGKSFRLSGTQQWSKEKIDEFETAAKNEKTEIDQLRLLIAKYPSKAAAALGYMLETQRTEHTNIEPEKTMTEKLAEVAVWQNPDMK